MKIFKVRFGLKVSPRTHLLGAINVSQTWFEVAISVFKLRFGATFKIHAYFNWEKLRKEIHMGTSGQQSEKDIEGVILIKYLLSSLFVYFLFIFNAPLSIINQNQYDLNMWWDEKATKSTRSIGIKYANRRSKWMWTKILRAFNLALLSKCLWMLEHS